MGRIRTLADGRVHLNEATDGDSFPIGEVKLEGSKENFARCLTGLLGARYKRLITALDEEETVYRLGPEFDDIVETMGGSFANILSILHKVLPHTSKNA